MLIASGDAMRRIDKRSISEFRIPGEQLMENAGKTVVDFLKKEFNNLQGRSVCVLCGRGNNGGDGLVVARLLNKEKIKSKVYLFARKEEVEGDVKLNLLRCEKDKLSVVHMTLSKDLEAEKEKLKKHDIFIDALLGTGFKGAVSGFYQNLIQFINTLPATVVSVDLPSGLNSNTGQVLGACIKADYTVTFGLNKIGLCVNPGVAFAGTTIITDIGFPEKAVSAENLKTHLIEHADAVLMLPKRTCDSNKGSFGKVFIVGGSIGMTGAPCMSALSALRSGCGLAMVGIPESLSSIVESKMTEVITKALPESSTRTLGSNADSHILELTKDFAALALGPGMGREKETGAMLRRVLEEVQIPVILDADALNLVATSPEMLKLTKVPLILTPHPGEMSRLAGVTAEYVQSARLEIAQEFAKKYGVIVVLKGARTIVATPDSSVYVNPTGNCGMATAGTGDVLTGVIASFIAQGLEPLQASLLSVYVHGLAGDLARDEKGEHGLIASDVIDKIPYAILKLKQ